MVLLEEGIPGRHAFMPLEISGGQESALAGIALVRSLSGVSANVFNENHLGSEVLTAYVALEPSLSCNGVWK